MRTLARNAHLTRITALVAAMLLAPAVHAQTTPTLSFDVASVRPAAVIDQATILATLRSGKRPGSLTIDGSRLTIKYMSLKELLAYAYKVRAFQVTGPDWLATDRLDIAAKLPDGATRDDVPTMMKALLADRLKVEAHLETKEHPVLALTIAKTGVKMKEAPPNPPVDESAPLKPGESKIDSIDGPVYLTRNNDGSTTYSMGSRGSFTLKIDPDTGNMRMLGNGMTTKGLAYMLTTLGGGNGRPVVDQTGLTGTYELAVEFSLQDLVSSLRDQGIDIPTRPGANAEAADPTGDSTVTDALAKLGLKLEKSKAPIEQLVVDHIEKAPTEN